MVETFKTEIWKQFGASLDMFENSLKQCPDELWTNEDTNFWYIAYHTLFYTDYYLSEEPDNFQPPPPYSPSEFQEGIMPERVYTKEELISYTQHCREKCRKLLADFTEEKARKPWINKWKNYTMFEMMLYNMRHVQHHVGQLNLLLGQIDHELPIWVSQTKATLN